MVSNKACTNDQRRINYSEKRAKVHPTQLIATRSKTHVLRLCEFPSDPAKETKAEGGCVGEVDVEDEAVVSVQACYRIGIGGAHKSN